MSSNIVWHESKVTRLARQELNGHRSTVLWFTGLSGSGKSTIAHSTELRLHALGCRTFVFDGDNVRHGLCKDLGFDPNDRSENIRRIGEVAKLFVEAGTIALTALISPFRTDRENVRSMFEPGDFCEIYCRCTLEECERRDVKGLYRRARAGEVPNFTGISSPYDPPIAAELVLDTDVSSIAECTEAVIGLLRRRGLIQCTTHLPRAVCELAGE